LQQEHIQLAYLTRFAQLLYLVKSLDHDSIRVHIYALL